MAECAAHTQVGSRCFGEARLWGFLGMANITQIAQGRTAMARFGGLRMGLQIRPAQIPDEVDLARQMFAEYQNWLDVDL